MTHSKLQGLRFMVGSLVVLVLGLAWGRPDVALAAGESRWFDNPNPTSQESNKIALGQTFTPPSDGKVSSIDLHFTTTESATATVYLCWDPTDGVNHLPQGRCGNYGGAVLATATQTFSSTGWVNFKFDQPVAVAKDRLYGVKAVITSGTAAYGTTGYDYPGDTSLEDKYPGGHLLRWGLGPYDFGYQKHDDLAFVIYQAPNTAPTPYNHTSLYLDEGEKRTITDYVLRYTDADGDPITYIVESLPQHGTLSKRNEPMQVGHTFTQQDIDAGAITYAHDGSDTTFDGFKFAVTDGIATIQKTLRMEIYPTAEAPVVSPAEVVVLEDTMTGLFVIEPDERDGGTVTHYVITKITGGWLYHSDGSRQVSQALVITAEEGAAGLRFMPYPDLNSEAGDDFGFAVAAALDAEGTGKGPGTWVSITVTAVNDAPSFTKGPNITVDEDSGAYSKGWVEAIKAGPIDERDQTLEFIVTNDNHALFTEHGQPALDAKTGKLTFTPAPDAYGAATVSVVLRDNGGDENGGKYESDPVSFQITVSPVHDQPVALPDTYEDETWVEDGGPFLLPTDLLTGHPMANDFPGEPEQVLSMKAVADGQHVTTYLDGNHIYFTPQANWHGTDTFTYTVKDDVGAEASSTITVTVKSVADAPSTTSMTIAENTAAEGLVIGRNSVDEVGEGEEGAVTHFKVEWEGTLGGTLALRGGTPVTKGEWYAFGEDGTRELIFTPAPDTFGTFTFAATAATSATGDGAGESATFTVTVNPVLAAPAVSPGVIETLEDTMTGLIAIEPDERDLVSHYVISGITGGELFLSNGSTPVAEGAAITAEEGAAGLRFWPSANLNSEAGDLFGFAVAAALDAEGTGKSPGTAVAITVTAVNDPPSFTKGPDITVDEDSGAYSEGWATDIDPGPHEATQTVSFTTTSDNPGLFTADGQPAVAADGTLTFTPAADASGSATVTVRAVDSCGGESAPESLLITVNQVNDAPTFNLGSTVTVLEDSGPYEAENFLTDRDAGEAGQTLTLTISIADDDRHLHHHREPGQRSPDGPGAELLGHGGPHALRHADRHGRGR